MAEIKKAYAEDLAKILPLIKEFDNPNIAESDWQKLFQHHWPESEEHFGFMALEGEEVVGFLGGIFSSREIGGRKEKFCNLTTWIVKEEQRGQSLSLLFKFLQEKEYTFTDLTANKVAKILRKFGFKDIDSYLHVFLPLPNLNPFAPKSKVITDPEKIKAVLNDKDRRILKDHLPLKCAHMLFQNDQGYAYLVYDIVRKKGLPVARVHYLSHPDFFKKHIRKTSFKICRKANVFGLLVGSHYLGEKRFPFSLLIPQKQALLFKSSSVKAEDMDTLYSELQVLGIRN